MNIMTMQQVQEVSLQILKWFDSLCTKQGFRYWVMYGTLLGAVRHKGFIPWDDDVDVAMPRKDYEQFRSFIQQHQELLHPYELHTYETTKGYPYYISRICEKNHIVSFEGNTYQSGIFIDIYPFDGMGDEKNYWIEQYNKTVKIRKHLTLSTYDGFLYGKNIINKILNIPNVIYSKSKGRLHFLKELDSIERQFSWEGSKYVSIPAWDPEVWFFEKDWFEKLERVQFENIEVNIPKEYDSVLIERYGDYMVLPPENQRVPHKDYYARKK